MLVLLEERFTLLPGAGMPPLPPSNIPPDVGADLFEPGAEAPPLTYDDLFGDLDSRPPDTSDGASPQSTDAPVNIMMHASSTRLRPK